MDKFETDHIIIASIPKYDWSNNERIRQIQDHDDAQQNERMKIYDNLQKAS